MQQIGLVFAASSDLPPGRSCRFFFTNSSQSARTSDVGEVEDKTALAFRPLFLILVARILVSDVDESRNCLHLLERPKR